jgi:hypothetical protein
VRKLVTHFIDQWVPATDIGRNGFHGSGSSV